MAVEPARKFDARSESLTEDSSLGEVLASYLEEIDSGRSPNREDLVAKHPGLSTEIRAFFENQDRLERFDPGARAGQAVEAAELAGTGQTVRAGQASQTEPRAFGGYVLIEEIARGGMGVVYRARQSKPDRVVALKLIHGGHLATESQRRRLRVEADAAARLEHPNIVAIFEIGEHAEQQYLTMRFLEGGSLAARIADFVGRVNEAAWLIETLARAVHHAHTRGVLHRDLKPANVLFDGEGNPQVADFGLAKLLETDSSLTATGDLLGTPSYMSPEQASGRVDEVTAATDVHALGIILYELFTGAPPFQGASRAETIRRTIEENAAVPSRLRTGIPRDVETICLKCLEKEPGKRFASALELAEELRRYRNGEPIRSRRATLLERCRKWARRRPVEAAFVVLCIVAAITLSILGVGYYTKSREASDQQIRRQTEARVQAEFLRRKGHAGLLKLAFQLWDTPNKRAQSIPIIDELRPTESAADLRDFAWNHLWRRRHPAGVLAPAISKGPERQHLVLSPDGKTLLFQSAESGFLRDPASGKALAQIPLHAGFGDMFALMPPAVFTSDSKRVVGVTQKLCYAVWEVRTGRQIYCSPKQERAIEHLVISPDDRLVATQLGEANVRLWDLQSGQPLRDLVSQHGEIRAMTFSGSSRTLAVFAADGSLTLWDPETATERASILKEVTAGFTMIGCSSQSPGILVTSPYLGLSLLDDLTGRPIPGGQMLPELTYGFHLSPDQSMLVSRRGNGEVFIHSIGREQPTVNAKINIATPEFAFAFSPDNLKLAVGNRDGELRIFEVSSGTQIIAFEAVGQIIYSITFLADSKSVVCSYYGGEVLWWKLPEVPDHPGVLGQGRAVGKIQGLASPVSWLAFVPGTHLLVSGTHYHGYSLWDLDPWLKGNRVEPLGVILAPIADTTWTTISADARWITTAFKDGTVRIWEFKYGSSGATSKEAGTFRAPRGLIRAMGFSKDNSVMVAVGKEQEGKVWRRDSGANSRWRESATFQVTLSDVCDIAVSPDGKTLAIAAGRLPWVLIWDLVNGREMARLEGHTEFVFAFAFTADSKRLATAGIDRRVLLWDLAAVASGESKSPILSFIGHTDCVSTLAFSPDEKCLASVGDETVRIWDLVTGDERGTLRCPTHGNNALAFSHDGRILASGGSPIPQSTGEVFLYYAAPEEETAGGGK